MFPIKEGGGGDRLSVVILNAGEGDDVSLFLDTTASWRAVDVAEDRDDGDGDNLNWIAS